MQTTLYILLCLSVITFFFTFFKDFQNSSSPPPFEQRKDTEPVPHFIVENPIFNSQKPLYIKAEDENTNRPKPLNVSYDGVVFHEKGIFLEQKENDFRWKFLLAEQNPSKEMKIDGKHQVRFGFPGGSMCEVIWVVVKNTPPKMRIETGRSRDGNDAYLIEGRAVNELQFSDDRIKVELYYLHDGANQKIDVPVKVKEDAETQMRYFEFSTTVQGVSKKLSKKINPEADFFGFKVIDQAGNAYYQLISYGQYMAPGRMKFGFQGFANINIQKISEEDTLRNVIRLTPMEPPIQSRMASGDPALIIQVNGTTKKRDIEILRSNLQKPKPITLIFRDNKVLGTTLTDRFLDKEQLEKGRKVVYRAEQEEADGTRYTSNIETIEPKELVILTLRSNVQDDSVFIDGKEYGKTRLDVELPLGKHIIRIEKSGYAKYEQQIDLKENRTVFAKLHPQCIPTWVVNPPSSKDGIYGAGLAKMQIAL